MSAGSFVRSLAVAGALAAAATQASAAVLFTDDFARDHAGSVLNASLTNWRVTRGSIDWISMPNPWGIRCLDGVSGCVDLDGSSGAAGTIVSNAWFALDADVTYTFSLWASGNQRGGGADRFTFGFVDAGNATLASRAVNGITAREPFTLYELSFTAPRDTLARLFVAAAGSDAQGAVLDRVRLAGNRVPEPGSLALFGALAFGWVATRRRSRSHRAGLQ